MATTVATSNIKRGIGFGPVASTAHQLVHRGVDLIGFQELIGARQKRLRKLLARQGYGLAQSWEGPIAYDLSRYKLMDSGNHFLGGRGDQGGGQAGGNPHRFANFVALRDRHTGQVTVMTNTHLGTKSQHRLTLQRRQARELVKFQAQLRQKYGSEANYFVTGDFNTSRKIALGLRSHHGSSPIDRIFSDNTLKGSSLLKNASDHNTFIATFRDPKVAGAGGRIPPEGPTNPPIPGHKTPPKHPGQKPPKSPFNQSAYDLFSSLLESWGVPVGSDIEAIIKKAMIEGRTPDQIDLLIPEIQQTKSWQQRFPGWSARVANGYNQLNVDEYLQLENSYHRIMQEAGLPAGFYDSPSDFGKWIANDVSPDEIQNRVGLAVKAAQSVDPTARNLMARFYGLSTGDIASYFLDQTRALPVIQRQYDAANVAAWAKKVGFNVSGMGRYENLVDEGITPEQAAQSYGTIKSLADTAGSLAGIYGDTYDQTDAEKDVFFGMDEKRRKLFAQEQATFSGSGRGATGSVKRADY